MELSRTAALYEAALTANSHLQAQLTASAERVVELAGRESPAEGIIRQVMDGFRAVMSPPPPAEPNRVAPIYTTAEDLLKDVYARPDPAWELPAEWGESPEGLVAADEREALEDG